MTESDGKSRGRLRSVRDARRPRKARLDTDVEYESSETIDLLIRSGRTIDAIGIGGWRVDVGYPEDRDRAEALLRGEEPVAVEE